MNIDELVKKHNLDPLVRGMIERSLAIGADIDEIDAELSNTNRPPVTTYCAGMSEEAIKSRREGEGGERGSA